MTAMFAIELAAKSLFVAAAVLALLVIFRGRSAAERSWVAHAGVGVLLSLPVAALALPRWRLLPPLEASEANLSAEGAAAVISPAAGLQALYLAGLALLLTGAVIGLLRLVALRREAAVLIDAGWLTALARAQERMGVKSGAALLVSQTLTSPVSWGLLRPTIVINQALVAKQGDAEAVIAHELAHVVHLDWAKLLLARLAVALFWFNPLVWILSRQCHQLREEAADDAVLNAKVSGPDYASLLVEAARHDRRGLIAAHGVAPASDSLHRRIARVLDCGARRTPAPAAWGLAVAAGAILFAAPLAALTLQRAVASSLRGGAATETADPVAHIVTASHGATSSAVTTRPGQGQRALEGREVAARAIRGAVGRTASDPAAGSQAVTLRPGATVAPTNIGAAELTTAGDPSLTTSAPAQASQGVRSYADAAHRLTVAPKTVETRSIDGRPSFVRVEAPGVSIDIRDTGSAAASDAGAFGRRIGEEAARAAVRQYGGDP